jgi:hypothetical protein
LTVVSPSSIQGVSKALPMLSDKDLPIHTVLFKSCASRTLRSSSLSRLLAQGAKREASAADFRR